MSGESQGNRDYHHFVTRVEHLRPLETHFPVGNSTGCRMQTVRFLGWLFVYCCSESPSAHASREHAQFSLLIRPPDSDCAGVSLSVFVLHDGALSRIRSFRWAQSRLR